MPRDEATRADILAAAARISRFISGLDRGAFLEDEKTQSAVLHELLVIGEASKRLSRAFRETRPGIPWREIVGMRDKLVHAYDSVDLEEVWRTASCDVPALVSRLAPENALPEGGPG